MILLDLDGVLADFGRGACIAHGHPHFAITNWDWYKDWGMSTTEFWRVLKTIGEDFYPIFVPPYPWAAELLDAVSSRGDFAIATASPSHPGLAAGKLHWIRKHLGNVPVITYMVGGHGGESAAKLKASGARGNILIDDNDENIAAFREAGGLAITFPQPWNELFASTGNRVMYVRESLDILQGVLGVA